MINDEELSTCFREYFEYLNTNDDKTTNNNHTAPEEDDKVRSCKMREYYYLKKLNLRLKCMKERHHLELKLLKSEYEDRKRMQYDQHMVMLKLRQTQTQQKYL